MMVLVTAACSDTSGDQLSSNQLDGSVPTRKLPADTGEPPRTEADGSGSEGGPGAADDAAAGDTIAWGSCEGTTIGAFLDRAPEAVFECGSVTVPLDHSGAIPGTLDIAVTVLRSSGSGDGGTLFVNPGGPGVAASDLLLGFVFEFFPRELWDAFDIVAVEPRGVGGSDPDFSCGSTDAIEELLESIEGLPDTAAETEAGEAAAQMCVDAMGPVAGYMGTRDVAGDMDLVREAMGETAISYLGFSYGSTIGVMYASQYPDRVRAMVVDGADNAADPVENAEDLVEETIEEIAPFEEQLAAALDSCRPSCPFGSDPAEALRDAAANAELIEDLFDGDDRAFVFAIIGTLYDEASWPDLHQGLVDLAAGDPTTLQPYTAINLDAEETYPNITEHVNCIDGWIVNPASRAEAFALAEEAFGDGRGDRFFEQFPLLRAIGESDPESGLTEVGAAGDSICSYYDVIVGEPLVEAFDGGDVPIVVIGNRSDPFTPFSESQELVDEVLSAGILVEVDHPAHTVYPENLCVNEIVHQTLIDGDLPEPGATCE